MHRIVFVVVAIILATVAPQAAKPTQAAQRCFTETGFCIDGRFREFWEQNGGLPVFGFPIGGEEQITVDGKTVTSQRFERNRLEYHPNNARPYDVLLGRLGADRITQQGRDWFTFAKSGDTGGCRVFAETGHAVCGDILKAWRANGLQIDGKKAVSEAESLALFGMPLSGLMTETLSDGKQYQVQWFERARFELHPQNPAPYNVLLGLLGNEVGYDETLNDRPLNEYSLQITDFPTGMTATTYEYYTNETAAETWENPTTALAIFKQVGRLNSFEGEFKRSHLVSSDNIGTDIFTTVVTRTTNSKNANEYFKIWSDQKSDYKRMFIPLDNIDESTTLIKERVSCNAVKQSGEEYDSTCTYIEVYMRKGNILLRLQARGLSENTNLDVITNYAKILAARLNT